MTPQEQVRAMVRSDLYDPRNRRDEISLMAALQALGPLFANEVLKQVYEDWKAGRCRN